jgi:hypothetical protein
MKAAARRWKMKSAVERLRIPGAAGQHDLFWEILAIWEKQAKARKDKDLIAVMDWLLFKVGLWKHTDLGPAAAKQLPDLVPEIGKRLLVARLGDWVVRQAGSFRGGEPWTWPEFAGKKRKHLATAAAELLQTGPKHNPLTRIWIAAAMLAGGAEGADKEMAATRKLLKQRLPSKFSGVSATVAISLAGTGVTKGLALLLDAAEAELDDRDKRAKSPDPRYRARPHGAYRPASRGWPTPLVRFYSLVRWMQPPGGAQTNERARGALTEAREWLKANLAKLKWDPAARRYAGGEPQAGLEKFFKAAAVLKEKYGYEEVDRLVDRQVSAASALARLLALADAKPALTGDENFAAVAAELIKLGGDALLRAGSSSSQDFFKKISKLPRPLAVEFYVSVFGDALRSTRRYNLSRLSLAQHADPAIFRAACEKLRPEFRKACETAAKGSDSGAALEAALRYLYVGGDVPQEKLTELVKSVSASSYSQRSHLKTWSETMIRSGMARGLRVCLALAQEESARSGSYYIRAFGKYAGWYTRNQYRYPDAKTELARALKWLPANESKLTWNAAEKRFGGAPAPGAEDVLKHAAEIEKRWKLNVRAASRERDAARRLFSEVVALASRNAEAAKDPKLMALVEGLVVIGRVREDTLLHKKLMVDVPKFNRALGARFWANYLKEKLAATTRHRSGPSGLTMLDRTFPGMDHSILPEACKLLRADAKKAWAAAANLKIDEKVRAALSYVAVGGTLEEVKVRDLFKEAEKLGTLTRLGLYYWGSAVAALGNVEGLELILIYAEKNPRAASSLGKYMYMVGKSKDKYGRDLWRLAPGGVKQKIGEEMRWLKANKKNLAFDAKTGRFKLKGAEVKPPPGGKKDPEVF